MIPTAWIPLLDTDEFNGGMQVIWHTHTNVNTFYILLSLYKTVIIFKKCKYFWVERISLADTNDTVHFRVHNFAKNMHYFNYITENKALFLLIFKGSKRCTQARKSWRTPMLLGEHVVCDTRRGDNDQNFRWLIIILKNPVTLFITKLKHKTRQYWYNKNIFSYCFFIFKTVYHY